MSIDFTEAPSNARHASTQASDSPKVVLIYDDTPEPLIEIQQTLKTKGYQAIHAHYQEMSKYFASAKNCIVISQLSNVKHISQLIGITRDNDEVVHIALTNDSHVSLLNEAVTNNALDKFLITPVSAATIEAHIISAQQEFHLRRKRDALLDDISQYSAQLNDLDHKLKTTLLNQGTGLLNNAQIDPLTNLPNRYLIFDRINQAIHMAKRKKTLTAILSIDIDRFAAINQSLGLRSGNQLLRSFSQRLIACTRQTDSVAREGNDEFILVLSDVDHSESVIQLIKRIRASLTEPFIIEGHEIFISVSIGICIYPHDALDAETLVRSANTAMKHAKKLGGNCYQYFEQEMNQRVRKIVDMESSLFRALEKDEFLMYYQPQVDLQSGQIVGAEALLRWQRPEEGIVSPNEFIPILEETGLIEQVGEWILHNVTEQNNKWLAKGLPPLRLSINLSLRQVQDTAILNKVSKIVSQFKSPAMNNIELEITESIMMKDADKAISLLIELNKMGFNLSIDDFGTGYASLNYLTQFPVHSLKIDLSFIHRIETSPKDAAIVKAIILMAHSLGLRVTAEGVETKEQLNFLDDCHCDEIQGYFFSKPLPPDEFEALLQSKKELAR